MNTIRIRWRRLLLLTLSWVLFFGVCGAGLAIAAWTRLSDDTIARNIWVGDTNVSTHSAQKARQEIAEHLPSLEGKVVTITLEDRSWSTPSASLGLHWNIDDPVEQALTVGRTGSFLRQYQERLGLAFVPIRFLVRAELDEALVRQFVASVSAEANVEGIRPAVQISASGYRIIPGETDALINQPELSQEILSHPEIASFSATTYSTITPLSEEELGQAEQRLQRLWGKTLTLTVSELEPNIVIPAREFFAWLALPAGFQSEALREQLHAWDESTKLEPVDAEFVRGEGNRLEKFQPHRNGRTLNQEELEGALFAALLDLETSDEKTTTVSMPFIETEPTVTLADTNNLGIQEQIGLGTSTYHGSIANRVYNVNLTSDRIGAVLIAPGEEFSFANTVGDISGASGYKSAYVIRNGRTELGDGGGVCQVSTTIFRAVLDAGLPITRWKNHSYRVGYYEQNEKPGFDATIYAPSVDFRFTNDTGHYMVLVPYNDSDSQFLRVELWGTNDGRESHIENYSLTNVRSAPPPLYQDDPSLPTGTRRQVDWAAPGATASFDYTVTKNGETVYEKTFRSVYRPWQAVFLVGTGT